jgi:2-dehydro-3-deoxygalactonokinase
VEVAAARLAIVPGLITRDARGIPDVMRGEETQLAGAVAADEHVIAILPGTHSKWARVENGVIVEFMTFMTGELYAVLLGHSILGRMATNSPATPLSPAFDRGVQHGLDSGSLTHDLFAARTLALTSELEPSDVEPWLSGLLIGREIRDAVPWARSGKADPPIRIIGEPSLCDRYTHALQAAGLSVKRGPADAAARGLWRIAGEAGLVGA